MISDFCAVGHLTRDLTWIDGSLASPATPGGAAYYLSIALRRLGRRVAVLTRLAREDQPALLSDLRREGIEVSSLESPSTTEFENLYTRGEPDRRFQRVRAVAAPFSAADLGRVQARCFHLGPLTSADMEPELLEAASARGEVSLDVQGLARRVEGGRIHPSRPERWEEWEAALARVAFLQASHEEARVLTGEEDPERAGRRLRALGAREVVITSGSRGSLVFSEGRVHRIPAVPTRLVADPTGCGDTYAAAYLHRRFASDDPEPAGRFAAAAATLALERRGPFRGSEAEVLAALSRSA